MGSFFQTYYPAEHWKHRHTIYSRLYIIMPAIAVTMAFLLASSYGTIDAYNWWYMTLLPGTVSIVCCMVSQADKKLHNRAVAALPVDLRHVWDAKVIFCIRAVILGNIILSLLTSVAAIVSELAAGVIMLADITLVQGAAAVVVMTIGCIWQIPLCLWANERFGLYPTLLANLALNLYGTIVVSLGSSWLINPYSVTARLMCPLIKVLPNGLIAEEGSLTYSPELMDMKAVPAGMLVCLAWLAILWAAARRWYGKRGGETI